MKQSKVDPCVYFKILHGVIYLIVAVYVDDFLILWKIKSEKENIKRFLSSEFKMKDLGRAKQCVGLRISNDNQGNYYLDQELYINEIIKRFGMADCNPISTPSDPNTKLSLAMSPKTPEERAALANIPYQQLVGALLYLVQGTRPDIAFAVGDVSKYNTNFGGEHWTAAKKILRYLKGTSELKIKYCSQASSGIIGYSDADWASDPDKRRSCTGYVFKLQNGAVSWNSKRQPTVALSTTEAEYMSLTSASQEAIWLNMFGQELGNLLPNVPTIIYCDNRSALNLATNDNYQSRSKHIDIRYHFIREKVAVGMINVQHISTELMAADSLTKAVHGPKQQFCTSQMGLTKI